MNQLILYYTEYCHLCDEAEALVLAVGLGGSLKKIENEAIKEALKQAGGNKIVAARILGIHPSTLYRKLKKLNLDS